MENIKTQDRTLAQSSGFDFTPLTQQEVDSINLSNDPTQANQGINYPLYESYIDKLIKTSKTAPVPNLTRIDSTKVHDVGPDMKYVELNGVTPVEHLQGRQIEGDESERLVPFKLLCTNPWQSLPAMPQIERNELDNILSEFKLDPNMDLDYFSDLALTFLGYTDFNDTYRTQEMNAFRIFATQRPNLAMYILRDGINRLDYDNETKEKLVTLAKHKLMVYQPVTYDKLDDKGENSVLSSLVSGVVPEGLGIGLNTPIYAMVVGSTIGPNIPENKVAKLFNEVVANATDPVLIITGHGGTHDKGYVLGENYNDSETLIQIIERLTKDGQKYSCIVTTGCNENQDDIEKLSNLNIPFFYVRGLHSLYFLMTGKAKSIGFNPATQTQVEFKNDIDAMLGIKYDDQTYTYVKVNR